MRLLFALVSLFLLAVANAHHSPHHKLEYPEFIPSYTFQYDVTLNVSSGVPGMHSQVAKSVIKMQLDIHAKSKSELIISAGKVLVSSALPEVASDSEKVDLKKNSALEDKLKKPFTATYERGKITKYTLDEAESLESAKIKRTILRTLELYLESPSKSALIKDTKLWSPYTYNVTMDSPFGHFSSHYVVTSSPDPYFPKDRNVYNISRSDNYEVLPYFTYQSHHNFERQGCPEVCTKDQKADNPFGAGCPTQQEPYHTPLKRSFQQKHNLRMFKRNKHWNTTIIDTIETKETHSADLYDQNMEVTFRSLITYVRYHTRKVNDPSNQKPYTNLNDYNIEINDDKIGSLCELPDSRKAVTTAKTILQEISATVIEAKIEKPEAKWVGEKIVLLQKALTLLKMGDIRNIQTTIVPFDQLASASEMDKVKRQIWLDIIPTIGTEESVSFIVNFLRESMNKPNKDISLWEAKAMLEALPMNILEPSEKTITELSTLLDVESNERTPGYTLFYSASHLAVARVIQILCHPSGGVPETEGVAAPWSIQREILQRRKLSEKSVYQRVCPKEAVDKFVEDISGKLKSTGDKTKRIIYIQTLARTGVRSVLRELEPFVQGHISSNVRVNRTYVDYVRTVTIHSLYHITPNHPKLVQDLLVPVFFNKTEIPKIRTAAFGVIVRTNPSLGLFQHIAAESWTEPSIEVASYVTSAMETYGNSTIPCHQLTARRIKKVLPLVKRVEGGCQNAKNKLWTLFDSIRGFGLDHKFEYTPSPESFYPSVVYAALRTHVDSFTDILYQFVLNSQGLSSTKVWDTLMEKLNITHADDIPKENESDIFGEHNLEARDIDFWRVTVFQKLFYTSAYYYYDDEGSNKHEFYTLLKDQFKHYLMDKQGKVDGHIVHVYVPSSYRAKALGYLPSPVEFEMKHPLLFSLKVKMDPSKNSAKKVSYSIDVKPSFYYTSLYTHQYLNLGDCKDIGTYHQKRVVATYPFRVTLGVAKDEQKFGFSYSVPELPKTVFSYDSEAGTYAAKRKLTPLPVSGDRKVFKTIPAQFKREDKYGFLGLPPFQSIVLTEDIQHGFNEVPRDSVESVNHLVKEFLNAGWRRKSVLLRRVPSSAWTPETEFKMNFRYSRNHVIPTAKASKDWTKELKFEDNLVARNPHVYEEEGQKVVKALAYIPHINDKVSVEVVQTLSKLPLVISNLDLSYRHTYGGVLHLLHLNASVENKTKPLSHLSMSASFSTVFAGRPDEFNYSPSTYGNQKALVLGSVAFNKRGPFTGSLAVTKGVFYFEPLQNILKSAMHPAPPAEAFYPETHKECVSDVSKGKSQSVACIKAIRQASKFNKLRMLALWSIPLPDPVLDVGRKVDLALKHAFFPHMTVSRKPESKSLSLDLTYIDRMTDRPVFDAVLLTPRENVTYRRVSTGSLVPMSSIDTLYDSWAHEYTNNTYPATCALMNNFIRTYDLKSYKLPREDLEACQYVLSTHCMHNKKFAVIVKIDPKVPGTKQIVIYLGKDTYTISMSKSSEYKIKVNESERVVKPHEPYMFDQRALVYATVHVTTDKNSPLDFHAKKAGIKITYNGNNLKLQVHPRYKGELCGLCSEFDGETTHEFRGLNKCLYPNAREFFIANALPDCPNELNQDVRPVCPKEEDSYSQPKWDEEQDVSEPALKRNMVLQRDDEFCYSIKPMLACERGSLPVMSEEQEIDFHCLPKSDREARKLVIESKRRILGEMETREVHHSQVVDVPTQC